MQSAAHPTPDPQFIPVAAAARRLSMSPAAVRAMIDRGELEAIKAGRVLRVSSAGLDAYIAAATVKPRSVPA